MTTIAMISGHVDLSKEDFDKFYLPKLKELIKNDVICFVLGGALGADKLAQEFLSSRNDNMNLIVMVYDKQDQNNVCYPNIKHVNGFASYTVRDEVMTSESTLDVCFVRRKGGIGSGTFQNVVRRKLGSKTASLLTKIIRSQPNSLTITIEDVKELLMTKLGEETAKIIINLAEEVACIE